MNETEHQGKKADAQAEAREEWLMRGYTYRGKGSTMSSPKHSSKLTPRAAAERRRQQERAMLNVAACHAKPAAAPQPAKHSRQYDKGKWINRPAAPQPRKAPPRGEPAKAAQAEAPREALNESMQYYAAELERVKVAMMTTEAVRLQETRRAIKAEQQRDELLAAAKYALDYASDVCPSSALPYESKLKAAIANAEKEAK